VCPGNIASRIFRTRLVGERIEAKSSDDVIPAAEAAQIILTGVANKGGIIALPENTDSNGECTGVPLEPLTGN
jgi:hypothetical protein